MAKRSLSVDVEYWPIRGQFTISRGARTLATVVVATVVQEGKRVRGECVPYPRYGETAENVEKAILDMADAIENGLTREELQDRMPAGAARNALDNALWDLEAKLTETPAAERAGLPRLQSLETAFTLGIDTPDAMAAKAAAAQDHRLLKIKLGADGDFERLEAIRAARPEARLIVDANEGWQPAQLEAYLAACAAAEVALLEQPLHADADACLAGIDHPIPICADESVHDRRGLAQVAERYDAINVKLDKTGGLTEALALIAAARDLDLKIMVGCMLGTSLAMAPAILAAQEADFVDLDGPLLLERDRVPGLRYVAGEVLPPTPDLWG